MHRPFEILEDLCKEQGIAVIAGTTEGEKREFFMDPLPDTLSDDELFERAMKGVKALGWSATPLHHRPPMELQPQDDERDALRVLLDFMRRGNVEVEHTAEYIEAAVHPRGRIFLDDLRAGRFSVQAYLDLHGMNQQAARFALDEFILASARSGFRCVRVIHGRGRHSQRQQPILKELIQRWLRSRRMSRRVVAYTSARQCDGGGGAVYILLRR